ncbi:MAG: hypothetical protein AB1689_13680 [Thermodesulfobacteriota bacterium]
MPLGESLVERAERTPEGYAAKVRVLAAIYVALNLVCAAVMALVVWRGRNLVTLAQRSNVETLVLAIVLILALFYVVTTVRGLVGALRMALLNLPALWSRDRAALEARKQRALADGDDAFSVHFDKALEHVDGVEPVRWEIADDTGSLGAIELSRATATVKARKQGLNNSVLAFLLGQILDVLGRRTPPESVTIAFWSNIEEEGASVYRSTVVAFHNLATGLGSEPLWPTIYLTAADVAHVGEALRRLVPALRNEALLPDVEYAVEYSVPVLPEPLAFLQLRRSERRADPVLTMGYALVIMTLVLVALVLLIAFPPWVPSK